MVGVSNPCAPSRGIPGRGTFFFLDTPVYNKRLLCILKKAFWGVCMVKHIFIRKKARRRQPYFQLLQCTHVCS